MFPGFMSGVERTMIVRDFEQVIKSPEAHRVTLVYRRYKTASASVPDPVYGGEDREEEPEPRRVLKVPCLQQIISARVLKTYPEGFLEVGDCIFWFSKNLDFEELVIGDLMVPESLYIEDVLGNAWEPKLHAAERERENLVLLEGNLQVGQPIKCRLRSNLPAQS